MSRKNKIAIEFDWPILKGTISKDYLPCGKPNCVCKAKRPKLHGPYYRWTGLLDGKRTSRTISKEAADECQRWISNYRKLEKRIDQILKKALENAPWNNIENRQAPETTRLSKK
jgi:hypothetical protein